MAKKTDPIEEQKQDSIKEVGQIIRDMCEAKTDEAIRMGVIKLTKNIVEIAELNLRRNQVSIDGGDILWLVTDAAGI